MEKLRKSETLDFTMEGYESPRIDVIEMEIETSILQMSGEDSTNENW